MEKAIHPEDLARLFIERANAGDVEGLVALYEPDAVLAVGEPVASGHDQIRAFYTRVLAKRREFPPVSQMKPLVHGELAMTTSRLPNGTISTEIARRQPDGSWLWKLDQLKIEPLKPQD